ncbi:YncE family protein [Streptomyces sp. IMTB 2501]|uniref:YVTN family beta-propeller repeat protein n=1 Tax=Streptomyces sp. IMTB 2501 TaxID=1776340 RepID=UPI0009A1C498
MRPVWVAMLLAAAGLAGCSGPSHAPTRAHSPSPGVAQTTDQKSRAAGLPGMPTVLDPNDIYAADRPGLLSKVVTGFPARIYVPNLRSNTVTVIDPATYRVVDTLPVGREPQHVVPSWDLKTLWVNNDLGNSLTPIDPSTGHAGKRVAVEDPYNLYFTPDGRYAVVMASNLKRLDFRDAHSMALVKSAPVACAGVNHADFSADGRYFIVSCEFSGDLLKVDTARMRVIARQKLPGGRSMPQDVKVSPDGRTWYIADMTRDGVWVLDGDRFTAPHLLPTGKGAHGLYVSRDSRTLFISNRGEGTISLLDLPSGRLRGKWRLPGGGSPDMGGLSADGKVLWLSGRYHNTVYAIATSDGHLIKKIPVGIEPHGLCVYPQPGRYSLGHTGVFR